MFLFLVRLDSGKLHKGCAENFFEALCEPINLLKHICQATRILELQCEWPKMMKDQIEEGGKSVKDSIDSMELNVNHSFSLEQKLNFRAEEFRHQLKQEIAGFEKFIDVIVIILDICMLPIMLLPFIWAGIYIAKFNRNSKSDNYYIDKSIEETDERRKALGLSSLLPLTKTEKKKYVRWFNMRIVEQEKLSLTISLAFTVFSMVIPLTFILADICTYKILHLGYEFFHSEMTRLPKPNIYRLKVTGDGFLSELLSNLLNTFEPLNSDTERRDALWRECFLEPTPPDYWLFVIMLLLFFICIVLCLLQVIFFSRIKRSCIFYRKRTRSIHLYTLLLEGRDKTVLQQLEKK
uniref:Dendritic cell-specific transmembrane protein-like domain-containing protein n=1 Tax=Ditylenchus dipsaci TaxID=166011 RepID=A0A915EV15_9BILA